MRKFITAIAADKNWREVVKVLIDILSPEISACPTPPNLGFLYLTDKLSKDAQSIVDLLRSLTTVPFWVGASGSAILSDGGQHTDRPAAACLLMHIPENEFSIIGVSQENYQADLQRVLDGSVTLAPRTAHIYFHPETGYPPQTALNRIYEQTMCFMTGGVSSGRGLQNVFTHNKCDDALSGCFFSETVPVVSALFEGFSTMGCEHKVTSCQNNVIFELDGKSAAYVLAEDLSSWLAPRHGKDDLTGLTLNELRAYLPALSAEIQMAFRYYKNDIMGRSIKSMSGCDDEKGWVSATHIAAEGEYLSFVVRDQAGLKADLAQKLMKLRARLQAEGTLNSIKGGVYISSASRLSRDEPSCELTLIKEIIGDIPLAGFYSSGEISRHSLYNFTALLTLFV
jgi:small ligand-binding sensory domain FIST